MKTLVDIKGQGLTELLGQKVILFCANYFYAGTLDGVNKTFVRLKDPQVVYETGAFSDPKWKDAQSINIPWLDVRIPMIESYGPGK